MTEHATGTDENLQDSRSLLQVISLKLVLLRDNEVCFFYPSFVFIVVIFYDFANKFVANGVTPLCFLKCGFVVPEDSSPKYPIPPVQFQ